MARITNVRKSETGNISAVKLDNGRELSLQDAVNETRQGNIDGVIVGTDRAGNCYLHSKRGQMDYKLSELPEF